jgi:pimeloyl-ACP methyl ester carboxylesterase
MEGRNGKYALIVTVAYLATACASLPNKQRVVVGEYNMTYAVQGEGSPVVVLESGFGETMESWSRVFPEVATFSTVFAYNRRGYEGSENHTKANENSTLKDVATTVGGVVLDTVAPTVSTAVTVATATIAITESVNNDRSTDLRTADQIVEELRALLKEAGEPPPYLLVGHSSGGLYAMYYAKTYPQEVMGLVLVDSSHPEQVKRCRERYGDEKCDPPWVVKTIMKALPDEMLGEFHGMEETGRQVIAAGPLPPIPLVVLSHGKDVSLGSAPIAEMWPAFQQELAAQLPNSKHIIAENSGHLIQKDQPELVIGAIREIVNNSREKGAP